MLKEALQYILDGMRPETQNLCGRAYVITPSGAQEVIETPIVPATLQLHSLDSIVKMIRTEAIHLADANTPALFVNIPSPTNVTCFSQPDFTQRCVRAVFYNDRGISFIEADGGMWRLTARNTIKAFLEEKLAAEIESGKLVVAL